MASGDASIRCNVWRSVQARIEWWDERTAPPKSNLSYEFRADTKFETLPTVNLNPAPITPDPVETFEQTLLEG